MIQLISRLTLLIILRRSSRQLVQGYIKLKLFSKEHFYSQIFSRSISSIFFYYNSNPSHELIMIIASSEIILNTANLHRQCIFNAIKEKKQTPIAKTPILGTKMFSYFYGNYWPLGSLYTHEKLWVIGILGFAELVFAFHFSVFFINCYFALTFM